jgi:hypothetical protein
MISTLRTTRRPSYRMTLLIIIITPLPGQEQCASENERVNMKFCVGSHIYIYARCAAFQ